MGRRGRCRIRTRRGRLRGRPSVSIEQHPAAQPIRCRGYLPHQDPFRSSRGGLARRLDTTAIDRLTAEPSSAAGRPATGRRIVAPLRGSTRWGASPSGSMIKNRSISFAPQPRYANPELVLDRAYNSDGCCTAGSGVAIPNGTTVFSVADQALSDGRLMVVAPPPTASYGVWSTPQTVEEASFQIQAIDPISGDLSVRANLYNFDPMDLASPEYARYVQPLGGCGHRGRLQRQRSRVFSLARWVHGLQ